MSLLFCLQSRLVTLPVQRKPQFVNQAYCLTFADTTSVLGDIFLVQQFLPQQYNLIYGYAIAQPSVQHMICIVQAAFFQCGEGFNTEMVAD